MSINEYPTVAMVTTTGVGGPWPSKSGGELHVLLALPVDARTRFFAHDSEEDAAVPVDIRGFRIYTVRGILRGGIGGNEFHRFRREFVVVLDGSVRWTFKDLAGDSRELTVKSGNGVVIPPFILHTYEALEDGSGLLVVANALFDPDDPRIRDTYPREEFEALRTEHAR